MVKQMQENPQAPSPKRPRKWPWILGVVVLAIILVVLVAVPAILSSGQFTQWVQAKIDNSTGGRTNIGNLSVGWFSGVEVDDFSFRGPNGWAVVDVDRITAQPNYGSLLTGNVAVDRAELDQPRIAVDLREKPPSKGGSSMDVNNVSRIRDMVVRNGTVQLTSTAGQTVKIADLNSDLSVRPPGGTSRFNVVMAVAQDEGPAEVRASGQATPSPKTGWSLRGLSGQVSVEVNNLNMASVAPLLDAAGIQVQAKGQVTGNVTSSIRNGQVENVNADIQGQSVDVTGPALKGDRIQTGQLNVRASLAQTGDTIDVNQLTLRTDWANISASGSFPKNIRSLAQLTESGAAFNLTSNFNVNLAAVLSQMPTLLAVQKGTQITSGTLSGNVSTVNQAGRPTLVAKVQVADLGGVVNGKKLSLPQPIQAAAQLSNTPQGAQLDNLDVTAPFAKITASGNFKQIKYNGQIDLQAMQSQLGPFINLGQYRIGGQVASTGQVSMQDNTTNLAGSLSVRQLALARPDGNNISVPQATANFNLGLNRRQQVLAIDTLNADTGFGTISVNKATIPLASNSQTPMNLQVAVDKFDLSKVKPYASFFASFPPDLLLGGIAQSQVNVTQDKGVYHIASNNTRIQNFQVASQGQPPFQQPEMTAVFDAYVNPTQKTIDSAKVQVRSPQITLDAQLSQTPQGNNVRAQGAVDGQMDWAAVAPLVSGLVPGQLSITGQRPISANFTSTYPAKDPNAMLANLTGKATVGFDQAKYLGFDVGPTNVNVQVQNGLMQIGPFASRVNNGTLDFSGRADLRQKPTMLTIPAPLHLVQNVQITPATAEQLFKFVNPIFANAASVAGAVNFDLQQLSIPLGSGSMTQDMQLNGTLWMDQVQLGASGLLNQIFSVGGGSIRGQMLTIHPTNLVMAKGVLRYDDMQIDVGDNPVNFRGSIGPKGALNMSIVLPYTSSGQTVRVSPGQQAQSAGRLVVPLAGTIDKPQLNLQNLIQSNVQEQILKGLGELLKKQ